jgi:protein translocase SEC61 complex gamma subunit
MSKGLYKQLKSFLTDCKNTIKLMKKPNLKEFLLTAKISGGIIFIVGLIGFFIYIVHYLIFKK